MDHSFGESSLGEGPQIGQHCTPVLHGDQTRFADDPTIPNLDIEDLNFKRDI